MSNEVYREEYKGFEIVIVRDEDTPNPMDDDCYPSRLLLWHRRYDTERLSGISNTERDSYDEDFLENPEDYYSLPVYGYDHGGLSASTTPFACGWDSGRLGVIILSKEEAAEHYGISTEEKAHEVLDAEVSNWNTWLQGHTWGYQIHKNGEEIASCYGYIQEDPTAAEESLLVDARGEVDALHESGKYDDAEIARETLEQLREVASSVHVDLDGVDTLPAEVSDKVRSFLQARAGLIESIRRNMEIPRVELNKEEHEEANSK